MYKIIGADKKEYGPVAADQIRHWIKEGRVNAQTHVCAEGTTEWKPLGTVAEFADDLGLSSAATAAAPVLGSMAGSAGREEALQAVKGPVIGLKVTAIIGLVLVGLGLVFNILSLAGMRLDFGLQQMGDPRLQQIFSRLGGGLGLVQDLIGAGIGIAIFMGAVKMQRLENYSFALTASVLAMVPCISPCCLLGLPFGIWALVTLNRPEIKGQFV